MCGIFCILGLNSNTDVNTSSFRNEYELFKPLLDRRGPDHQSSTTVECSNHCLLFAASVLWLQGKEMTKQPVQNDESVFVFNGDIFGGSISASERGSFGDTVPLLQLLQKSEDITGDLIKLRGPYTFIYLNKKKGKLYFGRDLFGRRSLLIGTKGKSLLILSVARRGVGVNFIELPAIGIFSYDLKTEEITLHSWPFQHSNFQQNVNELQALLNKQIKINQNADLKRHIFVNPTDEDLQYYQFQSEDIFLHLLNNERFSQNVNRLKVLIEKAIQKRISTQPKYCQNCILTKTTCRHSVTGVLFSGGIDCAILALLADKYCEEGCSIDLLNVSFSDKAPDRQTGLQTLEELKRLRPDRSWNFIEINVDDNELNREREERIADLIYPLNTVLDDSLGCALWFASRGQTDTYISPCRVLLVGMGADELFGGYTKHRAALKRDGWQGLHEALENDWQNISFRNLARDDRVVSDHGRQLRTPYLDEKVVEFLRNLPCWERTCPTDDLPRGVGEKILLRALAYDLGLKGASFLKKRALQFGSRIANSKENAHNVSVRLYKS